MNDDTDLKTLFARLRKADHADAPAWNAEQLSRPAKSKSETVTWWRPAVAFAVAMLLAAVWLQIKDTREHRNRLTLSTDGWLASERNPSPLFASLTRSQVSAEWPSDVLTPDHLNLIIP